MWNEQESYEEQEEILEITVGEDGVGLRLDAYLAAAGEMTRSAASKLVEKGMVTLGGAIPAKNTKLRAGDKIVCRLPSPEIAEAIPEDIPLDVIYEDRDIIIVNKPQGMVVHPAAGNPDGTLVNALLFHCGESLSGIGGVIRPGIVHRIDKDTAGLLVVAKNDAAHQFLSEELRFHRVSRIYDAIVLGNFKEDSGTVDAPIGRHPADRKRMAIIRDPARRSRDAVTHWRVVERFGRFTHIRCELETGRTHQIRVHMSSIGHPLLGDPVYGGDGTVFEAHHRKLFRGQFLFASELHLTHPVTKEAMTFSAERPENFERVLVLLGYL